MDGMLQRVALDLSVRLQHDLSWSHIVQRNLLLKNTLWGHQLIVHGDGHGLNQNFNARLLLDPVTIAERVTLHVREAEHLLDALSLAFHDRLPMKTFAADLQNIK